MDLPNACQESGQLYSMDRATLVIVRKVTAHADGPGYFPVGIQNEDATGSVSDASALSSAPCWVEC